MNLGTLCAFDWETSGDLPEYALQPWRIPKGKAWGTSLAWVRYADGKPLIQGGVLDDETMDEAERHARCKAMAQVMLEEAIEHKLVLGGWNTVFDVSILIAYGLEDLVAQCRFVDGMLLWRHFFIEPEYDEDRSKKRPYGLKTFVAENLPEYAGYNDEVDFHDRSVAARADLHRYNVRDCIATYAGIKLLWNALTPRQRVAAAIEAQSTPLVAAANVIGLPVDVLATRELQASLHVTAAKCLKELSPFGVTEQVVRSPKQLGVLLYDEWGLPVLKENVGKKTKVVSRATDKEVLHELAFKDPRAKTLHHYREALGNCTKFADNILESADYNEDGRVHPTANIFGTYSSRLTYASKQGKNKDARPIGFAIHQEKRGKLFRAALIAPPDYDLAEFDAVTQEIRWMAIQSGDEAMLAMCLPGEDIHSFMAAAIGGEDYRALMARVMAGEASAAALRKLGKLANLSCLSGETRVLTHQGLKRIVDVQSDDLVWDGVEFVQHGGVVFQGVQKVLTYSGVTATDDHEVLTYEGWRHLSEAAEHKAALQDGRCWAALWSLDCSWGRRWEVIKLQSAVSMRVWSAGVCQLLRPAGQSQPVLRWLRGRQIAGHKKSMESHNAGGQETHPAVQRGPIKVCQSEAPRLSVLRRTRDRVQVWLDIGHGSVRINTRVPSSNRFAPDRPAKQRRALRAKEYNFVNLEGAMRQQESLPKNSEEAVYDILDCGPRSRFVAEGVIVHNCQYRTSAPRLRVKARVDYDIPMELPQAQHIRAVYLATYPGVPDYWKSSIAKVKRLGYAETLAGRRVTVQGNWAGPDAWSMEGTAINYPIQGTGGEQKYLALAVLRSYLSAERIHFAWDLHDGLYFFIPKAKTAKAMPTIKKMLDNLPYKQAWGFTPPIPMPFDAKVGGSWGALQDWRE